MANTLNFGAGKWAAKAGSVLAYNSENNNFKPLPFTFTRASTATRVNESGLIESVASGIPRIDFLNNADGHLLLEPSRTNQLIGSSTSGFTLARSTRGDRSYKLGIVDGYEYSFTSANPNMNYNYSESTLGYKTFSIFIDATNSDYFNIRLATGGGADFGARATFTPSTQSFSSITQNATYVRNSSVGYDYFGNNIYRIWITTEFILYSGGTTFPILYFGDNTNVWIGGAQIEAGSYATSYIPTSGSSVTRAADAASQITPSGILNNAKGTIFLSFRRPTGSLDFSAFGVSDGTTNNEAFFRLTTEDTIEYYVRSGGAQTASLGYSSADLNVPVKLAVVYDTNYASAYVNGVLFGLDLTVTAPAAINRIHFTRGNGTLNFVGEVFDAQYYNEVLSASQLIALTS